MYSTNDDSEYYIRKFRNVNETEVGPKLSESKSSIHHYDSLSPLVRDLIEGQLQQELICDKKLYVKFMILPFERPYNVNDIQSIIRNTSTAFLLDHPREVNLRID